MTQGFVPAVRQLPPSVANSDLIIAAPPELAVSTGLLMRLLPVGISIATVGVMMVAFLTGSGMTRNPTFLAFPVMMLVSVAVTAVAGRGQRKGRGVEASRVDYFGYLSRLRRDVTETASAQRYSLDWTHPDPDTLWTLIGGPRMWERRPNDWDFCLIRVGTGTQPLAQRLVAPEILTEERRDPITAVAVQRFIRAYSAIDGAPTTIGLRGIESLLVEGESDQVRGLLRAMICQLAVLHPPDQLLIAGVISDQNRAHWDWLKWLPHNQHPTATDSVGLARMTYRSPVQLQSAVTGLGLPYLVVIADLDEPANFGSAAAITHMTVLETGAGGSPLMLRHAGEAHASVFPDYLSPWTRWYVHAGSPGTASRRWARTRAGHVWSASTMSLCSTRPRCGATKLIAIGSVFRSEPLPTGRRLNWISRNQRRAVWGHTGSVWGPPGRASRSYCAPSRWA